MAKFNCPHCGEQVEIKVLLKDVTDISKSKTLDSGSFDEALADSVVKAFAAVEHPRSKTKMSEKAKDPLMQMFRDMHGELAKQVEEAEKSGLINRKPKISHDSDDNVYISEDKATKGAEIANKLNNLFGGK